MPGSGNAGKWVDATAIRAGRSTSSPGSRRSRIDETRGYVQRVIENSVVYDSMRSAQPQQTALHVSRYLGKSQPG